MADIEELVRSIEEKCPIEIHTAAGRLFSTVRRMKMEKEPAVPISRRTGFVISAKTGKSANEMDDAEWDQSYRALSTDLQRDYPELYQRLFP